MSIAELLLLLTPVVPLLLAVASPGLRRPARWLPLAPLPGLACALAGPDGVLELPRLLLGLQLALDGTGAVFLGLCALLWIGAGLYANGYLGGKPRERSFCVFWNLTLAGNLGVCLAVDVISFYLFFSALSLAAYVLVIHDREPGSLRAGRIYIALALFGEMALLLGLLMGAHAAGSMLIVQVRDALPASPLGGFALLALLAGLGLKAGLVPLHGWLPLAHAAAPVPASAVLSGAIVKAGILGLLRFLPEGGALGPWAAVLVWVGLGTAYAGVLLGLPQQLPKAVLAYSTLSQMGLLVAVMGAGLASPAAAPVQAVAALYAVHHGLVKGAMFLSVGLLARGDRRRRRVVLAVAALLGASLAGLPLTGGALAKLAAKGALGEGAVAVLASVSAAGTLLLVLRFLWLAAAQAREAPPAAGSPAPMALAFGAVSLAALSLPWLLFAGGLQQDPRYALQPAALWASLWPALLGLLLAAAGWRLRRWWPVGAVPVGDVAAWAESAWAATWQGRAPASAPRDHAPAADAAPGGPAAPLERWALRLADWPAGAAALGVLAVLVAWLLR